MLLGQTDRPTISNVTPTNVTRPAQEHHHSVCRPHRQYIKELRVSVLRRGHRLNIAAVPAYGCGAHLSWISNMPESRRIHLDTPVDDGDQSVPLAALGEQTARLEITADGVSRMNTMPCRLPRHHDRDWSAYLGRLDEASRLSVATKSNTILQCHPSTSLRVMCEKMGIGE